MDGKGKCNAFLSMPLTKLCRNRIPICSWKICVLFIDTGKFENSFPAFGESGTLNSDTFTHSWYLVTSLFCWNFKEH